MASFVFPSTAQGWLDLTNEIVRKNAAEERILRGLLEEKGIELTADRADILLALQHDKTRALLSRQSQNASETRDLKFDPVFEKVRGIGQFLKSIYKPNFKALGAWGIPILDSGKINYPANVMDRVRIFNSIFDTNASLPAEQNKLTLFLTTNGINMAKLKEATEVATTQNNTFEETARQAEAETEERDKLLLPVIEHLKAIGDFLMKLYTGNPRQVGLWGFTVDESTAKPKERKTTLKLGEKITLKGVQIGSVLVDIGETDLHVYKGSSTTGNPIIIHPGEKFGIQKGYSTITVSNPNLLKSAKFTSVSTSA